jgi:Protein of unknown function (DUF3027)
MLDALTDAQKFALTALLEVTPVTTVGEFAGETSEAEYITTYRFATTMSGYPGWNWTITVAHLPDAEPTIVESELTPAEGALLAPDWVPWSERMEDYRAAQAALGEDLNADADDDGSDDDDDDDDDLGGDILHGGDLDGVDIDEIDEPELDDLDESDLNEPDLDEPVQLEALDLQVNEGEQPKAEGDSRSEDPPRVPRRRQRARKEQQNNQGD